MTQFEKLSEVQSLDRVQKEHIQSSTGLGTITIDKWFHAEWDDLCVQTMKDHLDLPGSSNKDFHTTPKPLVCNYVNKDPYEVISIWFLVFHSRKNVEYVVIEGKLPHIFREYLKSKRVKKKALKEFGIK